MRGLVLYFSGTGNTKTVAQEYVKSFEKRNWEMEIHSFEENKEFDAGLYDCLVIGFPKYYELPPMQVLRWVKECLKAFSKPTKILLFCTQCGPTKVPDYFLTKILKEKKGDVVSCVYYQMANNYFLVSAFAPNTDLEIKIRNLNIKSKVEQVVDNFFNHKKVKESMGAGMEVLCLLFFKGYEKYIPRQIKQITTNDKCNHCGKCERSCPMKNIKMTETGPQLGLNCLMCVRCLNGCHQFAFQYKNKGIPRYEKMKMQYHEEWNKQ